MTSINMDKRLKMEANIPLSDTQVKALCDGKVKIVTYPELARCKSMKELLAPYNSVIILYISMGNVGHWCALNQVSDGKGKKKLLEFFDPYGSKPDDHLFPLPADFRKKNNMIRAHLCNLMYDSGFPLSYNEHGFQKLAENIQTCGRWCALRVMLKDLTLKQFDEIFNISKYIGIPKDIIATSLTQI